MELKILRKKIDKVDLEILNLIEKRLKICGKVGDFKKQNNLPIFDSNREKEIFKKLDFLSHKKSLDKVFIRRLFKLIMKQSGKKQK